MQGQANQAAQSSIMDQWSRQGGPMLDESRLMRIKSGMLVFVVVFVPSGQPNLATPQNPLFSHRSTPNE